MIILGSAIIGMGIMGYSVYRMAVTSSETGSGVQPDQIEAEHSSAETASDEAVGCEEEMQSIDEESIEEESESVEEESIEADADLLVSPEELAEWGVLNSLDEVAQQIKDFHITHSLEKLEEILACPTYRGDPEGYLGHMWTESFTEGDIAKYLLVLALTRLHQQPVYQARLGALLLEDEEDIEDVHAEVITADHEEVSALV